MSKFQVGDKVRTHPATVVEIPATYRIVVEHDDGMKAYYHTDYVELVERPLNIVPGARYRHRYTGSEFIVLDRSTYWSVDDRGTITSENGVEMLVSGPGYELVTE